MEQPNKQEMDILREIATMVSGTASVALSQLISKKVNLTVPEVSVISVEKLSEELGSPEEVRTIVLVRVGGDTPGTMLLFFTPENARKLSNFLNNRENTSGELDEMDKSALKEMGNILSGSAFSALSNYLNLILLQSIPDITTDMVGSIMGSTAAEFGIVTSEIIFMNTSFDMDNGNVKGNIFLIFDPRSTQVILEGIKQKIKELNQ